MILDGLFSHHGKMLKHQKMIKIGLVIGALLVLRIRKSTNGVISSEPTHGYKNNSIRTKGSVKDVESEFKCNRFVLNRLPPRATLRIQGRKEQREHYYQLIAALKGMKLRNINVIVDLNPSDGRCVYLVEVNLLFDDDTCMWVYPLRNYQPNSDLFLVAKEFFTPRVKIDFRDLLLSNSPSNNLEISLKQSREDLKILMKFIRAISFIRSHPYGTYFYMPVGDSYFEAVVFLPSTILIMIYYIFDWFCVPHHVSLARILLGSILYFKCPLSFVFFLRRNEAQCLIPIFMALNFKVGLFYVGLCYMRMVCDVIGIVTSLPGIRFESQKSCARKIC